MKLTKETKLQILLGVFVTMILCAELLGTKITTVAGITTSVAIILFPVTFLITDIVGEVYGKKKARQFVLIGILTIVLTFAITALFVVLPPASRYDFNDAYRAVFEPSLRIMLASLVAFAVSQLHDVWAFDFWKTKMHGKRLWLRNNLSTIVSQAIDTLLFMFIAFYQVTPKFTVVFVLTIALPYYILKVVMAAVDTPFVYLGVKWLKKR